MIAVDVCRRCYGWLTIGPTLEVEHLTETPTSIIVRVDHDMGDYELPKVGGCRCPAGTHPPADARAIEVELRAWIDQPRDSTWCY